MQFPLDRHPNQSYTQRMTAPQTDQTSTVLQDAIAVAARLEAEEQERREREQLEAFLAKRLDSMLIAA